jgi:hypothetical protein
MPWSYGGGPMINGPGKQAIKNPPSGVTILSHRQGVSPFLLPATGLLSRPTGHTRHISSGLDRAGAITAAIETER